MLAERTTLVPKLVEHGYFVVHDRRIASRPPVFDLHASHANADVAFRTREEVLCFVNGRHLPKRVHGCRNHLQIILEELVGSLGHWMFGAVVVECLRVGDDKTHVLRELMHGGVVERFHLSLNACQVHEMWGFSKAPLRRDIGMPSEEPGGGALNHMLHNVRQDRFQGWRVRYHPRFRPIPLSNEGGAGRGWAVKLCASNPFFELCPIRRHLGLAQRRERRVDLKEGTAVWRKARTVCRCAAKHLCETVLAVIGAT